MNKYYNHVGITVDEDGRHLGQNSDAWLAWDDVFVLGPDGTRHPTKQELDDCLLEPACDHVRALLERLRDVAMEAP